MNIAMIVWSTAISGGTKVEFELAKYLALRRHKIILICLGSKRHWWFDFSEVRGKVRLYYIEPDFWFPFVGRASIYALYDRLLNIFRSPYKLDRIRYLASRMPTSCDIYIATYFPSALALHLSPVKGEKVYFVQDSPMLAYYNEGAYGLKLFELTLGLPFSKFLANSQFTKKLILRYNARARVLSGVVGIDTDLYKPSPQNNKDTRRGKRYKVLIILRRSKIKGGNVAIETLNLLSNRLPLYAIIVGDKPRMFARNIKFPYEYHGEVQPEKWHNSIELLMHSSLHHMSKHLDYLPWRLWLQVRL